MYLLFAPAFLFLGLLDFHLLFLMDKDEAPLPGVPAPIISRWFFYSYRKANRFYRANHWLFLVAASICAVCGILQLTGILPDTEFAFALLMALAISLAIYGVMFLPLLLLFRSWRHEGRAGGCLPPAAFFALAIATLLLIINVLLGPFRAT